MKNVLAILFFVIISLSTQPIWACSFAYGYFVGEPYSDYVKFSGERPEPPAIEKVEITRGFNDGNLGSCSDAGIIEITLENTSKYNIKSYEIKLVKGEFPDHVIPESFITPIRLSSGKTGFRLVWLDMPAGVTDLEPIDAVLEIRQLSYGNKLSEAKMLRIINNPEASKSQNKNASYKAPAN